MPARAAGCPPSRSPPRAAGAVRGVKSQEVVQEFGVHAVGDVVGVSGRLEFEYLLVMQGNRNALPLVVSNDKRRPWQLKPSQGRPADELAVYSAGSACRITGRPPWSCQRDRMVTSPVSPE